MLADSAARCAVVGVATAIFSRYLALQQRTRSNNTDRCAIIQPEPASGLRPHAAADTAAALTARGGQPAATMACGESGRVGARLSVRALGGLRETPDQPSPPNARWGPWRDSPLVPSEATPSPAHLARPSRRGRQRANRTCKLARPAGVSRDRRRVYPAGPFRRRQSEPAARYETEMLVTASSLTRCPTRPSGCGARPPPRRAWAAASARTAGAPPAAPRAQSR